MNRLLLVFVFGVVAVLGLGFYRGWFHVTSESADGEANVTFTVDSNKLEEDRKKAQQKAQDLGHWGKDKSQPPSEERRDQALPSAPPPQNQE